MANDKLRFLVVPVSEEDENPLAETDLAYGIVIDDVAKMVWFPKSEIQEFTKSDGIVSFWCPQWLVEAKEVEGFVDTQFEPGLFGDE